MDPKPRRILNPAAVRARLSTPPSMLRVRPDIPLPHPDDDVVLGDVPCCRAPHPRQEKPEYRGRAHGVRFPMSLPDGYVVRATRVITSVEEKQMGRLSVQCASSDCRAITEYEIRIRADILAELRESGDL